MLRKRKDFYQSMLELRAKEPASSYRYDIAEPTSDVLLMAPHGGAIESGTAEIARMIAGSDFKLFAFIGQRRDAKGRLSGNFSRLHVTSEHYDDPDARRIAAGADIVVAIHGTGLPEAHVGGLDVELAGKIQNALRGAKFPVATKAAPHLAATRKQNICNLNASKRGVQIELPRAMRSREARDQVAKIILSAMTEQLKAQSNYASTASN
ncbi:poly-gamma-glutamate hydrolase family protein [Mesorhizobium sp. KR9-304]|uniref:poly-gamma-glutamate hydrolase family protein n=1 Tax=Mesorhizobium sp. KR9-304 TaxID=3156614 RepID=UPI0032B60FD3